MGEEYKSIMQGLKEFAEMTNNKELLKNIVNQMKMDAESEENNAKIKLQEDLEETPKYKIFYRYDRYQRSYEIWVEDVNTKDYPEVYHEWVGNKDDLRFVINELSKEYNTQDIEKYK